MPAVADNPLTIPPSLIRQVGLDNVDFVSNDHLLEVMSQTSATPEQEDEAVSINTQARLHALKTPSLVLAAVALLAVFPSHGLPSYDPRGSVRRVSTAGAKRRRNSLHPLPKRMAIRPITLEQAGRLTQGCKREFTA